MSEPITSLNFRDLGGLPSSAGQVRSGLLYRSEGPRNFSASQLVELQALGMRAIIDLRSAEEREEMPHQWHGPDCNWLGLDVDADLRVFGDDGRQRLSQGPEPVIAIDTMTETYSSIPKSLARHWPVIAEVLLSGAKPVLVNCTAGKDRTGVAIAFLLELAGVPRDAIMQDYLASSVFGENMFRAGTIEAGFMGSYGFLPSPGQIEALVGVRPEYLEAAWIAAEHGGSGLDGYFEDAGVDRNTRKAILDMLVQSS
jgi:protein-tyrosine phosphatase